MDYNNAAISLTGLGWSNSSTVSTAFVRVNFGFDVVIKSITGQLRHTAANNSDASIRLNLNGSEQMRVINENDDSIYDWQQFEEFSSWADPDGVTVDQVVFQAYADGVGTIEWQNVRICYSLAS